MGNDYTIKGTITRWDLTYNYLRLGVSRPALYTATLFKEELEKAGIKVNGTVKSTKMPPNGERLYEFKGRSIANAVKEINQESNNFVSEQLNIYAGIKASTGVPQGSREQGRTALAQFLGDQVGLKGPFKVGDASGLSTDTKLTPVQFVNLLTYIYTETSLRKPILGSMTLQGHHPHAAAPIPPENMTIYIKSGTLPATGVNSAVGFLMLRDVKEVYAFAILVNREPYSKDRSQMWSGTYTIPLIQAMIDGFSD